MSTFMLLFRWYRNPTFKVDAWPNLFLYGVRIAFIFDVLCPDER